MDKLQTTVLDPLKPYLIPITSKLPEPVNNAIISLIGPSCHQTLVLDLDLTENPECTSLAISKALGLAIVSASAIVKVPQILKLINSGSSAGVSFTSYALETASLLITLSYSIRNQFPFSTYGESAFIAVQDVVVGILVLTFAGKPAAAATWVAVVAASIYALLVDQMLVDAQTMAYLQAGAGLLGVASKAPQIFTIWREGSTGQLSAFAVCRSEARTISSHRAPSTDLFFFKGVQLSRRIPLPHLYYHQGGRRPAHPVRLHRRIHSERHPCGPGALLLEEPCQTQEGG